MRSDDWFLSDLNVYWPCLYRWIIFMVNVLNFHIPKFMNKMAYMYANSANPDQTALEGAVWSGSTLFAISLSILRNKCIKSKSLAKKVQDEVFEILGHLLYPQYTNPLYNAVPLSQSKTLLWSSKNPALVAQLDVRLDWWSGGCRFYPSWVNNILSWRWIMKYFLKSFSPFRWFEKGSCQFLAKECLCVCLGRGGMG